jgi:hypothetical protein
VESPPAGPAHVATVSFLASRVTPTGGFWIGLAGGVALARVALRRGLRQGFGASLAAMLETVAIMGPARFGVPLTQAVTAPILGRLEARGTRQLFQVVVCGAIRLIHNTVTTAFFIWVIAGGLDAYSGTYERLANRVGIALDSQGTLAITAVGLLVWAVFASTVQVAVYRRGLRTWSDEEDHGQPVADPVPAPPRRRYDPRAVALAAALAFALLLAGTDWLLLGGISLWLGLAWASARADRSVLPTGLIFTALLGGGAFIFTLGGGLGLELAARRGLRAALLVLVATWLRAAAGADGLREVFRRVLGRLRAIPAMQEAAAVLDRIGSEGRLLEAGRSLAAAVRSVPKRPLPILDAVLAWVAGESARFRAGTAAPVAGLAARPLDWALVALAAVPALALSVA